MCLSVREGAFIADAECSVFLSIFLQLSDAYLNNVSRFMIDLCDLFRGLGFAGLMGVTQARPKDCDRYFCLWNVKQRNCP